LYARQNHEPGIDGEKRVGTAQSTRTLIANRRRDTRPVFPAGDLLEVTCRERR